MLLHLGISLTAPDRREPALRPESAAVVAAMTPLPDRAQRQAIDTLVGALQAAGIWAKLDLLYVLAAHSREAAHLNWAAPGQHTLVPVGTPTFAPDSHYVGNGTNQYLGTGRQATAFTRHTQGSAHLAYWRADSHPGGASHVALGNRWSYLGGFDTTRSGGNLTRNAGVTFAAPTNGPGLLLATRSNTIAYDVFLNGGAKQAVTTGGGSQAPTASNEARILGGEINGAAYYGREAILAASWGAGLTDAEVAAYHGALRAYLAAIGYLGDAYPLDAGTAIVLGDSTIAAFNGHNPVTHYLSTRQATTNAAVPGHTIAQQSAAWDGIAAATKASAAWVVVQVGLNNLDPARTAAQEIAEYQALVTKVRAGTPAGCRVLVARILPCYGRLVTVYAANAPAAQAKWVALNGAIAGEGATPITGVDGRIGAHVPVMDDGTGRLAGPYNTGDGIHETNLGRRVVARAWADGLRAAGVDAVPIN